MFTVGDRLENVHTGKQFTVIEIAIVKNYPKDLRVLVLADDNMQETRVGADFVGHYRLA